MPTQSEIATDQLRQRILRGEFPLGADLQENELAAALRMSRTPVRAALHTLAQEGLLDHEPRRGYRVRRFSVDEIREAYEIRATLEGMACRIIAENGLDRRTAAILGECVDAGEQSLALDDRTELDRETWRKANERFHLTILRAAANATLERMVVELHRTPLTTLRTIAHWGTLETADMVRRSQLDHVNILDALSRGQSFRAEARMREHIQVAGQMVCACYEDEAASPATAASAMATGPAPA